MTNPTKDPRPDATPDAAIEPRSASKTQPGLGVSQATSDPGSLESRIRVRRAQLIGMLGELKTDARLETIEVRDKLKAALSELAHVLKWGVVDGWASIGVPVTNKLEQWLAASAHQVAAKNERA